MISIRLSDQTIRHLEELQKKYKRSAATVVAYAIHAIYMQADPEEFEEWMELPE